MALHHASEEEEVLALGDPLDLEDHPLRTLVAPEGPASEGDLRQTGIQTGDQCHHQAWALRHT